MVVGGRQEGSARGAPGCTAPPEMPVRGRARHLDCYG